MEILDSFGFEPVFFTAQIINFLILAFVFKKFLYKPVLKLLNDRSKKIAQGLEDAQEARLALEKAEAQKDEIIRAATLEAEKIIDETRKSAKDLKQELLDFAKADAQKIIEEAKATADESMDQSRRQAKNLSIDISKRVLNRILSEMFTESEKEKILARNISRLKEYD
jgi:F-type H+-transporting ATPase subunit b